MAIFNSYVKLPEGNPNHKSIKTSRSEGTTLPTPAGTAAPPRCAASRPLGAQRHAPLTGPPGPSPR